MEHNTFYCNYLTLETGSHSNVVCVCAHVKRQTQRRARERERERDEREREKQKERKREREREPERVMADVVGLSEDSPGIETLSFCS